MLFGAGLGVSSGSRRMGVGLPGPGQNRLPARGMGPRRGNDGLGSNYCDQEDPVLLTCPNAMATSLPLRGRGRQSPLWV